MKDPASTGAAAAGLLAVALAGCGGEVVGQPQPSPAVSSLVSFDGCTALSQEQLQSLGLRPQGDPLDRAGEVGCSWLGDPFSMSITKDSDDGLAYYEQQAPRFTKYEENAVAGFPGAQIASTATGEECGQVIEVGGGSVVVGISYDPGHQGDPCADALRIAEMIAPKLPR